MRVKKIPLETSVQVMTEAENLLREREFEPSSDAVLSLASFSEQPGWRVDPLVTLPLQLPPGVSYARFGGSEFKDRNAFEHRIELPPRVADTFG